MFTWFFVQVVFLFRSAGEFGDDFTEISTVILGRLPQSTTLLSIRWGRLNLKLAGQILRLDIAVQKCGQLGL